MTREELKQLVTELIGYSSADHQARTSEILTSISEGFDTVLNDSEQAQNRVSELTTNNETLRRVNADLFLKVGAKAPVDADPTPDVPDEPVSYDTLFNEKGELI